jgi:predicted AlkP superfamily phosphohydrolase/phosphomutase
VTRARRTKALIIGIDGGTFDIVDPLVAAGRLPNLAGLMRRGASARTTTTWPAHTAPGWTTLLTASHPGGHGIYQFFDTQDPGYAATIRGSGDVGRSTVWEWLAAQGYTLGLVNIPMSHPPQDLPGYQITWPLTQTLRYCRPAGLLAELRSQGAHLQPDLATMFRGDLSYIDQAHDYVGIRARAVARLMRERPADVVMVVFTEVDRVCHHYWHFGDAGHPRHPDEAAPGGWRTAVERIHEALDEAIGALLDEVDDDTAVVMVSDHGSGPGQYELCVNSVLEAGGLLATRPSGDGASAGEASWFAENGRAVDFSRTAAYTPVPGSFGINLNLAGRQRDGIVDPADHDRVLAEVISLLSTVELPERGGPAFRAVVPREAAYPGPQMLSGPDLVLVPREETFVVNAGLDDTGWRPSWQTGLHRHAGMWVHSSPRACPGRMAGSVPLTDVMPTLLDDLGAAWPATVHGSPVPGALTGDPAMAYRRLDAVPFDAVPFDAVPLDEPAATPTPPVPDRAAAEEDAYTANRLREMGYI